MDYLFSQDLESVMEIMGKTTEELASDLGVSRITISNWLNEKTAVSPNHIQVFYTYAYRNGVRLNKIKEQFYREDCIYGNEILLFHGSKTMIGGPLDIERSKKRNDFGKGFYCGESLEQSSMFVSGYEDSSLYMLKFDPSDLRCKRFCVDKEWMLTVAYFRGKLEEYENLEIIRNISNIKKSADYIVAPIADNRMFEIIDSFTDGEITDIQCQHCLSATDLGMQYIFLNNKTLPNVTLLERCYLCDLEKKEYLDRRQESFRMNQDKIKLARRQYRNQGEYIEDILV